MEIRVLNNNDRSQIQKIIQYSFQFFSQSDNVINWYFDHMVELHHCIGVIENEKLVSSLIVFPFDMFYYGKSIKMGGIAAVGTLPEFRYRHHVRELLKYSFAMMREKGQFYSVLFPFSTQFYRKFGYEPIFYQNELTVALEDLAKFTGCGGEFKELSYDDYPVIAECYNRFMSRYNGGLKRSPTEWKKHFNNIPEKQYQYGLIDKGWITGYLIYSIKETQITVNDFIYNGVNEKRQLLNFLFRHNAQQKTVKFNHIPDDDTMLLELDNPRAPQWKRTTSMMGRVIDVLALIEKMTVDSSVQGTVKIEIIDYYAPWNHKTLLLTASLGKILAKESDNPDITMTINEFSRLVVGFVDFRTANSIGAITVHRELGAENEALLNALFVKRTTFISDMF